MSNLDFDFIQQELEKEPHDRLKEYLRKNVDPLIDIVNVQDAQGFNLLHLAALKDSKGKIEMIINLFKQGLDLKVKGDKDNKEQILEEGKKTMLNWVNQKTREDQFSPLHFASFSGNLDAVKNLMANHADLN